MLGSICTKGISIGGVLASIGGWWKGCPDIDGVVLLVMVVVLVVRAVQYWGGMGVVPPIKACLPP